LVLTNKHFWHFLALFGTFGTFWHFLALFGTFWHFFATFWNFWALLGTFWHFNGDILPTKISLKGGNVSNADNGYTLLCSLGKK
jgi:hypothetical protein